MCSLANDIQHLLLPGLTMARQETIQAHETFSTHSSPARKLQSQLDLVDLQLQNLVYLKNAHFQYFQASSDQEHLGQALQAHQAHLEAEEHAHLRDLELLAL